ncbi:hypothetical protein K438DRAFT_1965790 [Mycena galopus ATCC 62051]|nr:hypothetical protein K438DRAFT_1965790 [Mycena galopus ATCC 62051]
MPIQGLPLELIEEVLDKLADDSNSLRICSLVCRAWLSRCRSHLFKSCRLHTKGLGGVDNTLSFGDLLRSPHCTFIAHVRRLESLRYSSDADDSHFQEIALDLRRLSGVVELEMDACVDPRNANAASFFSAGFFMSFPQVTRLFLDYTFISDGRSLPGRLPSLPIIDLICLFPELQELEVVTTVGRFADPPGDGLPPQGLRVLTLRGVAPFPILAWLHACNRLHIVNSMTVSHERDVPTVLAALQQIGGALHHLDIDLEKLPQFVVGFSLHPHLRILVIRWWDMTPAAMISFMRSLAGLPLERLSLDIDLDCFRTFNWAAVDVFLSPVRYPFRRSVKFWCMGDEDKLLRRGLPCLEASGKLQTGYDIIRAAG